MVYLDKIKVIAKSLGRPELADKVKEDCKSGKAFFFGYDDCFIVLKVLDYCGCLCVHIECAYSERQDGFKFGYRFVSDRAEELGAKYITFSTANKGLERMASKCGWARISQGEMLSSWIIEL